MAGEEKKSFLLRVDPALWEALEKWAADELRSVNGQIEWALREAVRKKFGEKRLDRNASRAEGKKDRRQEGGER